MNSTGEITILVKNTNMEVSELLRRCLRKSGLKQKDLCDRMGIGRNAMSGYFTGRSEVSFSVAIDMLREMGYDVVLLDRECGRIEL